MALNGSDRPEQPESQASLARRIRLGRFRARLSLVAEQALPLLVVPVSIASLFLSAAWFGVFRSLPDMLRWPLVFVLTFFFFASLLPLKGLRWPKRQQADHRLEQLNGLPHQAISAQDDHPVGDAPFAMALWQQHRKRLAASVGPLEAGLPRPDISHFDGAGLRAIPALVYTIALAYSVSGNSGRISDAFRNHPSLDIMAGQRVDVWITPPSYTGRPAVTLAAGDTTPPVPQFSTLTVRISGGGDAGAVRFTDSTGKDSALKPIVASTDTTAANENASDAAAGEATRVAKAESFGLRLERDGLLTAGGETYAIRLTPDEAPRIDFDGKPRRTVNGALEIRFKTSDDYGLMRARAEIAPLDQAPQAQPLFPLPEFPLDLPRGKGRDLKGVTSKNLTEHPLAGKRIRLTLVAEDGGGQVARSPVIEMELPGRSFTEPLAAAVAEQRQIFSLDVRALQRAIDFNDAVTLRGDESIPNPTHFLLLKSARARMALSRNEVMLKDTAAYLWEMALGMDGGDLPMAEQAVRDAQKALSEALKRNAPDKEIQALMDNLRKAMKDYMAAMAKRMQQQKPGQQQGEARNVIRQQDLERMMDQLENMARSGNKAAAEQLLSEMQRLMNNLQAGPSQRQPSEAENKAREQMDKLGKILTEQQKLLDETFKLNKQMEQQQWQGTDPGMPQDQDGNPDPGQGQQDQGQQEPGTDPGNQQGGLTKEQREAMRSLQQRQQALQQQLQELGRNLKGLGMKPGKGLDQAGREMGGAAGSLGKGEGEQAAEGQGRAIEALRKGAKEMMQAMGGQGQGGGQAGNGQGGGQSGRDPLGRSASDGNFGDTSDGKVPDEIDVQRAREILDQIRRKLGDGGITPTGRQYLERLLNLN